MKKKEPAVKIPDPDGKHRAAVSLSASCNASAVITEYGKIFGEQDTNEVYDILTAASSKISGGDMSKVEAMLINQAHALQSMFTNFSRRALNQQYQSNLESFFKMALKAQNQCRMTLETLATIKNPPVIYARQANINQGGNQQVNNGMPAVSPHVAHTVEIQNQTNELLSDEVQHGETLDTGRTSETSECHSTLEALDAQHRPAKS